MASYSVTRAKHATLAASTVDTVTLTSPYPSVEVLNRDGAAAIYFTVDGSTPTVEGDNTFVLLDSKSALEVNTNSGTTSVVKLISAGTPTYSVTGVDRR